MKGLRDGAAGDVLSCAFDLGNGLSDDCEKDEIV